MTGAPPAVAAIIVTHNSSTVIRDCLCGLADATQGVRLTEVVVADNASRDATADLVHATAAATGLPVRVLPLGRNAGYAAAINAAAATLLAPAPVPLTVPVPAGSGTGPAEPAAPPPAADYLLVLNPDARPMPASVAALVHALDRPGAGIAAPRLLTADGRLQHSLRRSPTVTRALAAAVLGGNRAGRWGRLGEVITDPHAYALPTPADWATGAALLVSARAWREIGPWDERFLLYSEETEYALRAADRGWTLWYEPAAVMRHLGGESGTSPWLWALLTVNRVRLYRARHGRAAGAAFHAAVTLGEALRAATGQATARAALRALLVPRTRLRVLPG